MVSICIIYVVVFGCCFFGMTDDNFFAVLLKAIAWPVVLVIRIAQIISALVR